MVGELLVAQEESPETIDCLGVNEEIVTQGCAGEQWDLSNNGIPQVSWNTEDPSELIAPFESDQVFVCEIESEELTVVYVGPPGRDGTNGGGGGGTVGSYRHVQSSASLAWVVYHNLGVKPVITVIVGGVETECRITYPNLQSALLEFNSAVTGEAYCVG